MIDAGEFYKQCVDYDVRLLRMNRRPSVHSIAEC